MKFVLWDNESVWPTFDLTIKCRSAWPISHGSMNLLCIFKAFWWMNLILWDKSQSVKSWPHNTCRSPWTMDNGSALCNNWPYNKCKSQWPILYCLVVLSWTYLEECSRIYVTFQRLSVSEAQPLTSTNVGHSDLYFMVQWVVPIFLRLFVSWTSFFEIMTECDVNIDLRKM